MYSARTMALLLAVLIALVTVLFLSLIDSVDQEALLVAGVISFSGSYLLVYVTLEFLVFREINKIYKMLGKLKKKELGGIQRQKSGALNPIKDINEEIYSFALLKQKEIDEQESAKTINLNRLRVSSSLKRFAERTLKELN